MSEGQPAVGSSTAKRRQPPTNEQYDSLAAKLEKAKRFCGELVKLKGPLPNAEAQEFERRHDCCSECFELLLECTCCNDCDLPHEHCVCEGDGVIEVTKGEARTAKLNDSKSTPALVQFALLACDYLGDDATWSDMSNVHTFFGVPTHKILTDLADARLCRDLKAALQYALPMLSSVRCADEKMLVAGGAIRRIAHGMLPSIQNNSDFDVFVFGPKSKPRPDGLPVQQASNSITRCWNTLAGRTVRFDRVIRAHQSCIDDERKDPRKEWAFARSRSYKLNVPGVGIALRLYPPLRGPSTTVNLVKTQHDTATQLVDSFDFAFLRSWWHLPDDAAPNGALTILDREALRTLESPYWPRGLAEGAIAQSNESTRLDKYIHSECLIWLTPEQLRIYSAHVRTSNR